MAMDQERADRIRDLKASRPDLTWRRIAESVDVTERAAAEWQKTGGIDYENAKKLAAVFEVDLDWLWRGPVDEEAPALLEVVAREETLAQVIDRFSRRVDEVEARLERIEANVTARVDHDKRVETLLAKQARILDDIRAIVGREDAFDALRQFAEAVAPEEPDTAAAQPPARKPAAQRSRRAS